GSQGGVDQLHLDPVEVGTALGAKGTDDEGPRSTRGCSQPYPCSLGNRLINELTLRFVQVYNSLFQPLLLLCLPKQAPFEKEVACPIACLPIFHQVTEPLPPEEELEIALDPVAQPSPPPDHGLIGELDILFTLRSQYEEDPGAGELTYQGLELAKLPQEDT